MRFVMHVSLPVDRFNEAVVDGSAGAKVGQILDDLKPEAAYFTAKDGKRGGFLIVNIADASEIPRYAEPWFLNFDATVEFLPTMTPDDLGRAGLDELGKKWGKRRCGRRKAEMVIERSQDAHANQRHHG